MTTDPPTKFVTKSHDFEKVRKCRACDLYLNQFPVLDITKSSNVFWVGLSSVMFTEEEIKLPLSPNTRSGSLIHEIEEPFQDTVSFYKTNIVKCLPLLNDKIRYPSKREIEKCYPNLLDEIKELKPKIVFLLGKIVSDYVLNEIFIKSYLLDDTFNYQSYLHEGIVYIPIHHPSFILVYRRKQVVDYINGISNHLRNLLIMDQRESISKVFQTA
jgi:uracil-DNA glycosylase